MPVAKDLLDILVCPETKQNLTLIPQEKVSALNERIAQRKLVNRAGITITGEVSGALLREDGRYLYRIEKDIPIMLIDEAIQTDGLALDFVQSETK